MPTPEKQQEPVGLPGPTEPEPEQVGRGDTLVSTRDGYEFHGTTVDVPITSVGVRVTKTQAKAIQAEAEANGEIVYIDGEEG